MNSVNSLICSSFIFNLRLPSSPSKLLSPKPISISATLNQSPSQFTPQKNQVYQPFRPPQSPLPPQYQSLDATAKLDILSNRLGLWFEYAPLITSLIQQGFTPSTIEESTGISGVHQNILIVAAQVRDSLIQSNTDPEIVAEFDTSGSELLYEIRLLNTDKRAAAARFIVQNRLDAKSAQDLARAMKDFPRRKGEKGWESFDYEFPGDCLAFMHFRLSREYKNSSEERFTALGEALRVAESEKAKKMIEGEIEEKEEKGSGDCENEGVRVPVVRMKYGEVAEASSVIVLPVCRAEEGEKEMKEAPWKCESEGGFGIVVAEEGWRRWVVLPPWEPLVGLAKGGAVVSFRDARALPWKVNQWYKEEAILVVVDRSRMEVVADDGFYMAAIGGELKVDRGNTLKEKEVKESLGRVVLVVRPPNDSNGDQLSDEDWE